MNSDAYDPAFGTRLIVEGESRPEEIKFLEESISQFNVQATGISDGKLLGVFLRTTDGAVAGGAFGWTWGGTCYLRHLYVPEHMRRQGHGTRLLQSVEQEARARGCQQMTLETHSFQAPGFYRRLGFEVIGRVDDYPRGHQYLMLMKHLA